MKNRQNFLSIGEVAQRTGVASSALRFYETRGLIQSQRMAGNHRRYHRAMIRRISIIRVGQTLGFSLNEISEALAKLPNKRTATKKDWAKLSATWGKRLDQRIAELQNLRDRLSGCIGCGCLSMKNCTLYNRGDTAARLGAGPRYLLGDVPAEPVNED